MITNREINNGQERDILQQEHLRENPYTLPQNYFAAVEDSVREKIQGKTAKEGGLKGILQTSIAFASVFAIVFGLGYGAMYVTGTTEKQQIEEIYSQVTEAATDTTLQNVNEDLIEQYLIDSNVSIATLASLE